MRLFIGFRLSAAISEQVKELRSLAGPGFGRSAAWVAPENLHLTCAFLGEVRAEEKLPGIKKAMDAVAGDQSRITVTLGGLGAFPSLERPRVLWLGLTEGADELKALAQKLRAGLKGGGFIFEREFSPHLTLCRVKFPPDASALAEAVNKARELKIRETVASLELIESRLLEAGRDYRTLYSTGLL